MKYFISFLLLTVCMLFAYGVAVGIPIGGASHTSGENITLAATSNLTITTYEKSIIPKEQLGGTSPDKTGIGDYLGRGYDADAETMYITFKVPGEWDEASDFTLRLHWSNESGTAIAENETVIWLTSYRCKNLTDKELLDAGDAETPSATYTQTGAAGTDKEGHTTDITLDYDSTDQPIEVDDTCCIKVSRDMTNDTYGADAIVYQYEIVYQAEGLPE